MRKILVLAALLLQCVMAKGQFRDPELAALDRSETAGAVEEQVQYLSSAAMEGRGAGSQGEKEAAEYVCGQLEAYGVDLLFGPEGDPFGIKRESGDTLTSRNVVGFIKGYDPDLNERYIVIGARLDNLGATVCNVNGDPRTTICYGANGNASGLSMLVELARMLSTGSVLLKRSVVLVAFGSSLEGGAGAWYFLHRSFGGTKNIDAMINLDMVGIPSGGFYAYTASNRDMNRILESVGETLQPIKPEIVTKEPVNSDHRIFYDAQIPSVLFTTGMYPEYNSSRDTADILEYEEMERVLEYLYNFTVVLAGSNKPEFRPSDQTKRKHVGDREVVPYFECDTKPSFLGSTDPTVFLRKWVYTYLRYPRHAQENGIQGTVLVDFVIDTKGKVRDVQVLRGASPELDAEAVRVIEASPDWKPGKVRGEKVKSEMSLYVEFRLQRKKERL